MRNNKDFSILALATMTGLRKPLLMMEYFKGFLQVWLR
jgi:hypothetical protein